MNLKDIGRVSAKSAPFKLLLKQNSLLIANTTKYDCINKCIYDDATCRLMYFNDNDKSCLVYGGPNVIIQNMNDNQINDLNGKFFGIQNEMKFRILSSFFFKKFYRKQYRICCER
jgi:hypothetical protein